MQEFEWELREWEEENVANKFYSLHVQVKPSKLIGMIDVYLDLLAIDFYIVHHNSLSFS